MILLCADTSTARLLLLALITPQKNYTLSLAVEGLEEELIPRVHDLLAQGGLSLGQIDGFVLGAGPGSFMGLRLGFAALKAWAWALKKPLGLVSSLEVFARSYGGLCAPTVDGKMQKVFCALFDGGLRLMPDSDLAPEDFKAALRPHPGARVLGFLGKGEQATAEGLCTAALALPRSAYLRGNDLLAAQPQYLRLSAAEEARNNG